MPLPLLRAVCAMMLITSAIAASGDTPYPSKTIKIVAPSGGGLLDLVARTAAERLAKELAATVIVENKPGAGGTLGAEVVAKAPADGYTLLLADSGILTLNDRLYSSLPYDTTTAFAPVSLVAEAPMVLVVPASSPVKSMRGLVEAARASPGKLFYGSAGKGTGGQVAMLLFESAADVKLTHVPYKGSAEAATAAASGQIDALFNNLATVGPLIQGGKVRALGVASSARIGAAPEIPTLAEQGLKDFQASAWFGLVAPAGTPPAIIATLEKALRAGMQDPTVVQRLDAAGIRGIASTTKEFRATIASERERTAALAGKGMLSSE